MQDKKNDNDIHTVEFSVPCNNLYQKEINHHVRNTLQIIISLTDLYAQRIRNYEAFGMLFTLLESQYRALSCPYDIIKEGNGMNEADLFDIFQWFQDYFENTPLFFTQKAAIYIHCPKGITIPYEGMQHFALWVHELFLAILLEEDNTKKYKDIHIYLNSKESQLCVCIEFVQNTKTVNIHNIDAANKGTMDIVKSLNKELFALLLNQLKGQQLASFSFMLPLGLCE